MPPVAWTEDLALGIPFADTDHRVLFDLLGQLNACIDAREESATLGSALNALIEYARYHFQREEILLDLCGFPDFEQHRAEHGRILADLGAMADLFAADPEALSAAGSREFFRNWLIDHIKGHDFAYRESCRSHVSAAETAAAVQFASATGASALARWRSLRILVIDDNPHFRDLAETIVKSSGIAEVSVVEDAGRGLDALQRRGADVILCDWLMDTMDGIQFAAQAGKFAGRIVLVTGFGDDTFRARAAEAGIRHFLEKPITAKALLEAIARAAAGAAERP